MAKAGLTPQRIVLTAAEAVDRDGPDAISMAGLARELGVQTASLYGHVRDRAELLDDVHVLALDELADQIAAATSGRSGRAAVEGLARAERAYATEHPGRWALLERAGPARVRSSDAAQRLVHYTWAVFLGYGLTKTDVVHATRMLGSLVNGFITLERSGAFGTRAPDPDASWDLMLRTIDDVLLGWASRPTRRASSAKGSSTTRSATSTRATKKSVRPRKESTSS